MNQTDLIRAVAADADLSQRQAKAAVIATLDTISDTLVDGGEVRLAGFGTFTVRQRAERVLSAPFAKGKVVPAHNAPAFRASPALKEAIK